MHLWGCWWVSRSWRGLRDGERSPNLLPITAGPMVWTKDLGGIPEILSEGLWGQNYFLIIIRHCHFHFYEYTGELSRGYLTGDGTITVMAPGMCASEIGTSLSSLIHHTLTPLFLTSCCFYFRIVPWIQSSLSQFYFSPSSDCFSSLVFELPSNLFTFNPSSTLPQSNHASTLPHKKPV